mmetsp:Transcript_53792/g.117692  ORF Transcript_53792/g.117692 Transcript_53792/m.117692 type:complete len:103 (+) Transcript_53792:439-747(+)
MPGEDPLPTRNSTEKLIDCHPEGVFLAATAAFSADAKAVSLCRVLLGTLQLLRHQDQLFFRAEIFLRLLPSARHQRSAAPALEGATAPDRRSSNVASRLKRH